MAENIKQSIPIEIQKQWEELHKQMNLTMLTMVQLGLPDNHKVGLALCCKSLVDILVAFKLVTPDMYRTLFNQVELVSKNIRKRAKLTKIRRNDVSQPNKI